MRTLSTILLPLRLLLLMLRLTINFGFSGTEVFGVMNSILAIPVVGDMLKFILGVSAAGLVYRVFTWAMGR